MPLAERGVRFQKMTNVFLRYFVDNRSPKLILHEIELKDEPDAEALMVSRDYLNLKAYRQAGKEKTWEWSAEKIGVHIDVLKEAKDHADGSGREITDPKTLERMALKEAKEKGLAPKKLHGDEDTDEEGVVLGDQSLGLHSDYHEQDTDESGELTGENLNETEHPRSGDRDTNETGDPVDDKD